MSYGTVNTPGGNATQNNSGLMSAKDKIKLDGVAENATNNIGTITEITTTSPLSGSGTSGSVAITHKVSGATAGSYGDSSAQTPDYGETFKVPYMTVDDTGHVTGISEHTVKIPTSDNVDTKVTNTLATTTKAYVTGTTSETTNTGTQVFDTGVYLDATAGQLVATTFKGELSGNATTATTLATERTVDGITFDGSASVSHFGTCSTSASTVAKTVSVSKFSLGTGAEVTVKFAYKNTATSPTLNVSGTGEKNIYVEGVAMTSDTSWNAGSVVRFAYDGTNWNVVGVTKDVDEKVAQTASTSSSSFPLLASASSSPTSGDTEKAIYKTSVTLTPSSGTITATTFSGSLSGNATTATTATTATKVGNSTVGGSTVPIYLSSGTPDACSVLSLDTTGNAATATKLATARTIRTSLSSTSTASFDGSANITPGITGTLPVGNGGTGNTTGTATLAITTEDTTNTLYPVGVTSGATTTLKRDTSVSMSGDTVTAGTFKGELSGNATTATTATNATKVAITSTNPTSQTTYYMPFKSSITATGGLLGNNGVRYRTLEGTTEDEGYGAIYIGNSTASGSEGNKYGRIRLYGTGTSYWDITGEKSNSTARTLYLPNTSGCITVATNGEATGGTTKPVYVSSTGKVTAMSDTVGGTAQPVYMANGEIRSLEGTVGSTYQPVFLENGVITAMSGTLSESYGGTGNTTGTATYVTTNLDTENTLYLLGVTSDVTKAPKRNTGVSMTGGNMSITGDFRIPHGKGIYIGDADGRSISVYENAQLLIGNDTYNTYIRGKNIYIDGMAYSTSDERMKNDIQNLADGYLETLDNLRPVQFYYNGEEKLRVGYIAQEVQAAIASAGLENCALVAEDDNGTLHLDYTELIPILHKKIQKQEEEITVLKELVSQLIEKSGS